MFSTTEHVGLNSTRIGYWQGGDCWQRWEFLEGKPWYCTWYEKYRLVAHDVKEIP